jgi:AcrR family transcriptional regulator
MVGGPHIRNRRKLGENELGQGRQKKRLRCSNHGEHGRDEGFRMGTLRKRRKGPKIIKSRIKNLDLIDLRRKQIVDGAIKVMTVKGFHGATVREIADAAGLTMGSLYNYVRSKEDIIFIVYDYVTRILREDMKEAISGIEDPGDRLKAAIRHNLNAVHQNQDTIMLLYRESAFLDKESLYAVLERETEYIKMFEELLRGYFRSEGKKVDETRLRITADLLSYVPVILALRRWSLRRRFESAGAVMDGIFNFMLNGIQFVQGKGQEHESGKKAERSETDK